MSKLEFITLLPISTLALMIVMFMLSLCFVRGQRLYLLLTLLAFLIVFWGFTYSGERVEAHGQSISVTPLLLFDRLGVFYSKLMVLTCMAIAVLAYPYLRQIHRHREEFYLLLLLVCLGAVILVLSQHFASFFLGLEILGISLFAMIAYPLGSQKTETGATRHCLEAAMKYLVLSSIASAFILLGLAFIYAQTGSMSVAGLQAYLNTTEVLSGLLLPGALILTLVGFGFKLSLVPFHWWTADVYQGAPTPVTALIATVAKGAMLLALIRYFIMSGALEFQSVLDTLTVVALVSMLVGNILALTQHNIKRLLAYSSIAHMGYLLVAYLGVANMASYTQDSLAMEAIAVYIAAYFVTTIGAFSVVSVVSECKELSPHVYDIHFYRGLFWRRPWVAACFIFILLSLAGIPLTLGFIAKFYIFAAGAQNELWGLLMAVVVGSAIGLYYYLRVIIVIVQKEPNDVSVEKNASWLDVAIIFGLTSMLIVLGVYPAPLISWVQL